MTGRLRLAEGIAHQIRASHRHRVPPPFGLAATGCLKPFADRHNAFRRFRAQLSASGGWESPDPPQGVWHLPPVADEVHRATLRSWRTFQACLPSGRETFSETWSRFGLTKSKPVGRPPGVPGAALQTLEGWEPTELPRLASMMVGLTVPLASRKAVPHLCPIQRLVSGT